MGFKPSCLLDSGTKVAPVRGILLGAQLQSALSSYLEQWFGKSAQSMTPAAAVSAVGYNVIFEGKVHVRATLHCMSDNAAALLAHVLNTFSLLRPL